MCTLLAESKVTSLIAKGQDRRQISGGRHVSVIRRAAGKIRRHVNDHHGLPYLKIESDYSDNDEGQIRTKIEAMFEMVAK